MSQTATAPIRSPLGSKDRVKTAIAAAAGTSVENYDFIAYGTAAALYFGTVFFPSDDPLTSTLLAFATLAVGFVMRPLGGAIGGYLGDRYGRKPVLVGAMIVMGAATFAIGLMPTYAQIGAAAPIILTVVRMIQGLAFGAEWGGAITMAYEHAPWHRRGMFAAIPQSGNPLGIALASGMFAWSATLEGDWQWRTPFLFSAVLVIVALIVRSRLSESPEFQEAQATGKTEKNPFLATLRDDWRGILRVIALRVVESFAYYSTATYLLNYISERDPELRPVALGAITAASITAIAVTFLAGSLTDRIGRRPVYIAGCIAAALFAFPMYLLTNDGEPVLVVTVFIIGIGVIHASLTGAQGSLLTEQFRTATRTSGASLGYQVAAALGGFAPLLAAALVGRFGWPGASVLYLAAALVGLVGILLTRETWGRDERARVNALVEAARLGRSVDGAEPCGSAPSLLRDPGFESVGEARLLGDPPPLVLVQSGQERFESGLEVGDALAFTEGHGEFDEDGVRGRAVDRGRVAVAAQRGGDGPERGLVVVLELAEDAGVVEGPLERRQRPVTAVLEFHGLVALDEQDAVPVGVHEGEAGGAGPVPGDARQALGEDLPVRRAHRRGEVGVVGGDVVDEDQAAARVLVRRVGALGRLAVVQREAAQLEHQVEVGPVLLVGHREPQGLEEGGGLLAGSAGKQGDGGLVRGHAHAVSFSGVPGRLDEISAHRL
ncbi:MFS transporter [Glycomyces albidus]|uniref:MFS transporter n=1 Tax=Glycomyces albidus TaxID=2656774 RepID=UPI002AD4C541|nr:MFS transporter [Glycomyces albidus]